MMSTALLWIGGILCIGFPVWVMVVFLLLIQYTKRPPQSHEPESRRGFPIEPGKVIDDRPGEKS